MLNLENIPQLAVAVVVAIVLIGVLLVSTINAVSVEEVDESFENPNPVGDLRLSYVTDNVSKSYSFTVSSDTVSVTGDWEGSLSLSQNQVIIGSNDYSLIIRDGSVYESVDNVPVAKSDTFSVTVSGGKINDTAYSYAYLPDSEGAYANYDSYEYGGSAYAVASFAGTTIMSKGSTITGDNPYGMTATVNKDDEGVTESITYGKD